MNIVSKSEITGYLVAPLVVPLIISATGIPELLEAKQLSFSIVIEFIQQLVVISIFALTGACAGYVFWLIIRRQALK